MLLCRDFKFDAAHNLIHYHGKCERLHGHTYRLRVTLEGTPDSEGMICDFAELKRIVNDLVISKRYPAAADSRIYRDVDIPRS